MPEWQVGTCDVCRILDNDQRPKKVTYCDFCLHPSQLILTDLGYIPIETAEKARFVISHDGQPHTITDVVPRDYKGSLIEVQVHGSKYPIIVSPDHLLLAGSIEHSWTKRRYLDGKIAFVSQIMWLRAKDITQEHALFLPRIEEETSSATIEIATNRAPKGPVPRAFSVSADEKLFRLLGFYLAEGHISLRKKNRTLLTTQRPSITTWSFGKNLREFLYASEVLQTLASYGLRPHLYTTDYGYRVAVYSVSFASWLESNFGTGASRKRIPFWAKLAPKERLAHLFDAYIAGDGDRNGPYARATTISEDLALDIRDVGIKLGYSTTLRKKQGSSRFQDRTVNAKPVYLLHFNTIPKKGHGLYWDEGHLFLKVKQVSMIEYEGKLYDIGVESAHSFIGPSCTFHNCGANICEHDLYSTRRVKAFLSAKGLSIEGLRNWLKTH